MKTLFIIILLLVVFYLLSAPHESTTQAGDSVPVEPVAAIPADSKRLEVVSFQCGQNSAYYSASITVRNLTASEVSFPNVFVEFTPKGGSPFTDSVNISPRHLPPNAMGDATLISRDEDGRRYGCNLLRIQDSGGARVD